MRVAMTGATGFIGRSVVRALQARGDEVVVFSRDAERARKQFPACECVQWSPEQTTGAWTQTLHDVDAVVHLAGEPVMAHRWNDAVKQRIRESRVEGTRHLVQAIAASERVRVLVTSSGVDYYGDTKDHRADESSPAGNGFLSEVCIAWEEQARAVTTLTQGRVRSVQLRTGVVLGEAGGALERMVTPFKMFVGGPLGHGTQYFPWIHLEDMVAIVLAALDRSDLSGPLNAVAPEPVTMRVLASALGNVLRRPSWMPVPAFALRAAIGEASALLLESKRVVPAELLRHGFEFRHTDVVPALRASLQASA